MPSMFRRPGDSSSESSSDAEEDTKPVQDDLDLLSRINTLHSTGSGRQPVLSSRPGMSRNNSQLRDLVLHSLLEDKALHEAAIRLGKDRSDPEVQELARTSYQALSSQLSGSDPSDIDQRYASDEMRQARAAAQRGINDAIARSQGQLPLRAAGGIPRALAQISSKSHVTSLFSNMASPVDMPLHGHPGLHTDRYVREFVELDMIGKGGYGKVYKVQHKLDNSLYAVKRIMVSDARLQKIKEHGPGEIESMLDEVRALARFDHGNIVRYHNCWLEFATTQAGVPRPSRIHNNRLIKGMEAVQTSLGGVSLGDSFSQTGPNYGKNIVFDSGITEPLDDDNIEIKSNMTDCKVKTPKERSRRSSHATIATISSSRSHKSAIESIGEEDDEDVENVPRHYLSYSQGLSTDISQSMMSHSDMPSHMVPMHNIAGPVLTLNVQMSLYDTNLAAYLSTEHTSFDAKPRLHHCFHPCISLELLSQIISGVEYLHAQGVVHRDLKPANIFLSLSTSRIPPSGSVDISTCRPCPARDALHITPRIGDFGLVAALGESCLAPDSFARPVGTEFYRPEGGSNISEKLDVFALGVVGFEMLCRFSTRMERADALTQLKQGDFPIGLFDCMEDGGDDVRELINRMVMAEEKERWGCHMVKEGIKKIVRQF
ncbi:kinase-like protein [Lojkania enalia]|uniref:Kinase-like protein n=1 Tax=Lojkania enalia TaxID=147567 RepID=A0A9P4KEH1_9PLEO|nr:kinase-like protein [Didymosphaeria enalia]